MNQDLTHTLKSLRGPVGVFDSGFGGLTVLNALQQALPQVSFLYLGDNARAPYGTRDFDTVYRFTLQAVKRLFEMGCPLVILACNTASAKALRSIQQNDLPVSSDPTRRVLGVIRPTAEHVAGLSQSGHIGIVATPGTVASRSYPLEIAKLAPGFVVTAHACPRWVPLVENGMAHTPETAAAVAADCRQLFADDPLIDTLILGCTHYPLLIDAITAACPRHVNILPQGHLVADSLVNYLQRHPEMDCRIRRDANTTYLTTGDPLAFASHAKVFTGHSVEALHITL